MLSTLTLNHLVYAGCCDKDFIGYISFTFITIQNVILSDRHQKVTGALENFFSSLDF